MYRRGIVKAVWGTRILVSTRMRTGQCLLDTDGDLYAPAPSVHVLMWRAEHRTLKISLLMCFFWRPHHNIQIKIGFFTAVFVRRLIIVVIMCQSKQGSGILCQGCTFIVGDGPTVSCWINSSDAY
ncbi:hypothetical protein KUCAC02_007473 [Chaenocephalus aceratus]|uniref:Uncharacterized protein n=1 Tax=Chaenocephalus aceratus TaxID=36190 RepID=A0ACB9X7H6_CHAAC|nr:hypothetical protein KUCAC02_007473 [Chaenocephalus aceratus]